MVLIEDLPPALQEQARAKLKASESKYHANRTEVDGITFDSCKEADYYARLKLLERAGIIKDLKLQPRFLLQDSFKHKGKTIRKIEYVADFMFNENGKKVVVDVKGMETQVYKLKRKLFLKKYGEEVEFREVH